MTSADATRSTAFGQSGSLSVADRLGIWLSGYRVRKEVGDFAGKADRRLRLRVPGPVHPHGPR